MQHGGLVLNSGCNLESFLSTLSTSSFLSSPQSLPLLFFPLHSLYLSFLSSPQSLFSFLSICTVCVAHQFLLACNILQSIPHDCPYFSHHHMFYRQYNNDILGVEVSYDYLINFFRNASSKLIFYNVFVNKSMVEGQIVICNTLRCALSKIQKI